MRAFFAQVFVDLAFVVAVGHAADSEPPCACADAIATVKADLQRELADLQRRLAHVEGKWTPLATSSSHAVDAAAVQSEPRRSTATPTNGPRMVQHEVRPMPSSARVPEPATRRLQMDAAGKTYTATRSWQLHEFPSGHTCESPGKAYLKPNMAAEGMTPIDYPTASATSTQFSLLSNVDGQARSEIQQMAAPLKVVHASDCSAAPTLDLPLSTTVQTLEVTGTLTVTGSTWTDIPMDSTAWTIQTRRAQYKIIDSIVYLRGGVRTGGGGTINANDVTLTLPPEARPSCSSACYRVLTAACITGASATDQMRIHVASSGEISCQQSNVADSMILDGVFFDI